MYLNPNYDYYHEVGLHVLVHICSYSQLLADCADNFCFNLFWNFDDHWRGFEEKVSKIGQNWWKMWQNYNFMQNRRKNGLELSGNWSHLEHFLVLGQFSVHISCFLSYLLFLQVIFVNFGHFVLTTHSSEETVSFSSSYFQLIFDNSLFFSLYTLYVSIIHAPRCYLGRIKRILRISWPQILFRIRFSRFLPRLSRFLARFSVASRPIFSPHDIRISRNELFIQLNLKTPHLNTKK